jgi:hypothetical protein
MTRSDIRDHFHRHAKTNRINAALVTLLAAGLARMEKRPTGGRPIERWFATDDAQARDRSDRSDESSTPRTT